LALTDPALFHVTLQTASWDDELHARKGFAHSELLMKDSVSLLRHKIQDHSLAFQDATMNAVVTLAAIEVKIMASSLAEMADPLLYSMERVTCRSARYI
jgi:hypothetical protein